MIKAADDGSDKLLAIVEIIEAERAIFQEDEQFVCKKALEGGRYRVGVPGDGASASQGNTAQSGLPNPRGYQTYRGPTMMPNCRICKTLETKRDTTEFY